MQDETTRPESRNGACEVIQPQPRFSTDDDLVAGRTSSPPTILLVEDEDSVRRLALRVLRRQGFNVLEAIDGEDALRVAGEEGLTITLLITDLIMPGIDGPQLARTLADRRPHMRVLFMSGYLEEDLQDRDLVADAGFLGKPFLPADLLLKVENMLAAPVGAEAVPRAGN